MFYHALFLHFHYVCKGIRRASSFAVTVFAFIVVLSSAAWATGIEGSDGSAPIVTVQNSGGVYEEPVCTDHNYDTYTAEVGTSENPAGHNYYDAPQNSGNTDNAIDVEDTFGDLVMGHGIGAGAYFFLTGPKDAPTGVSATQYGIDQANWATQDYNNADEYMDGDYSNFFIGGDVEGTYGSQYDNGWWIAAGDKPPTGADLTANQDLINAFIDTLESDDTNVMIYSSGGSSSEWREITSNMNVSVAEWTATYENTDLAPSPCPNADFATTEASAQFFGGQYASSTTALQWQWTEDGGGGDWDQYSVSHYNDLFGTSYVP